MNIYTFDFKIINKGKIQGFRAIGPIKASTFREANARARAEIRELMETCSLEGRPVLNTKWKH